MRYLLKEAEKHWEAAKAASRREVLWASQSGCGARGRPTRIVRWKGRHLGRTGMVAGHGATWLFVEGKMKCRPAPGQAGRRRQWQARGRQKTARRGTRKENLPTRKLFSAGSVTALSLHNGSCAERGCCPHALAGWGSSAHPALSQHGQAATSFCDWKAQRGRRRDAGADGRACTQQSCGDPPAPGRRWSRGNWRHRLRTSDECTRHAVPAEGLLPI